MVILPLTANQTATISNLLTNKKITDECKIGNKISLKGLHLPYQPVNMHSKPWWDRYRKRKYKPRSRLTLEMIIRKSFVETVKEYIAASSIAGIRHITDPNYTILQRLFWLGLLFSFLGIVIYFLQYTWMATLTKPLVVTSESFTYPIKDIDFPAVALCNINRISKKALKKLTLEMYPKLAKQNTTLTNLELFLQEMGRLIDFEYEQSWAHAKLTELFSLRPYSDQTVELMKALAPSCEEMLVKCRWAGKDVNCTSIFRVRRTILGHCCAFNYVLDFDSADRPHGTIEEVKRQIVPGSNNGLRIIIDSMVDDYAYPLGYRKGFELFIFDPTHFADMTGGRVLHRIVQPNQAQFYQLTSIRQVASAEVRKYPLKTRKCLFRDDYAKEFKSMYSYSACIVKCRIQSVQSLCKCTPYFLPTGISTHTSTCTLKNLKCLNKYKEKLQYLYPIDAEDIEGLEQELADSLFCPICLPDCELTQHFTTAYKIPLHHGPMRNRGFINGFIEGVNLSDKCIVSIYQSTNQGILHRLDVISYWFEILSNIGGFSGMLMGIGIYTSVEVIYFVFIRFVQIIHSNYSKYG